MFAFAPMNFSSSAPPPAAAPTTLPRASAFLANAGASATEYYTISNTAMPYPNSDWAEIVCVKLHYGTAISQQYLVCNGGTGSNNFMALMIVSNKVGLYGNIAGNSYLQYSASADILPSLLNNGGIYYFCLRRVGANLEIAVCPKGGTASTYISYAASGIAAMTPNTSTMTIGARADQNSPLVKGNLSYYARVNGTFTNAQLQNLAAGQDIMADLALSPLCYLNFNTAGSTVSDASGNSRNATSHGSPVLRGGPSFSGAPITIDSGFDNWYGRVFQRSPGQTNASIKNTVLFGTYKGSPSSILVSVLDKTGTQVVAPTRASTPSAGIWSVTLPSVAQGSEYTVKAVFGNDATKVAYSQMPWGVGFVLLCAGESIMDGQAVGSSYTDTGFAPNLEQTSIIQIPDSWTNSISFSAGAKALDATDLSLWYCNTSHTSASTGTFSADRAAHSTYWTKITAGSCQTDTINSANGSIMHVIERVRANLGIPVMAIFGAKTGSQLVGNWNNYSDPVTHGKVKAALFNTGGDAEALLWVQGANDANAASPPTTSAYQTALQGLIPQLRSYVAGRTAAQLPAFVNLLGRNSAGDSAVDSGWRTVRNGQIAAISNITNCFDSGVMHDVSHVNNLHPDNAGYVRIGKREAQALLNYYLSGSFLTGMQGAVPGTPTISGSNTIDIPFTLINGTSLQGLTGSSGITGFVFKDGSAATQTPTGVVVQSATSVRATFSGTPVTGWTIDYCPTQNPDVTNLLYTNAMVVGDTVGVPVKPFTSSLTL